MSSPKSDQEPTNPFYSAFDLLLAKLLAAEQAVLVSEAAFKQVVASQDEWLAEIPAGRLPGMMADICGSSRGWVKDIPSLRWPNREADYLLRALRDFNTQSYLWAIARAFEAFREFVESIEEWLRETTDLSSEAKMPSSDSAEESRRPSFAVVLNRIRKDVPALVCCEERNAREIQLQTWISVAAKVRHAVAHNEGILEQEDYEKYRSSGLQKYFPGELEDETGYVLKPTLESTGKAIRTLREYGVAIYKTASKARCFPPILVEPDGEITTWRR